MPTDGENALKTLARLWHYVRCYKGRLLLGILLGLLSALLSVACLPTLRGVFETLFEEGGPESFRWVEQAEWLGPLKPVLMRVVTFLLDNRFTGLVIVVGVLVVLKVLQGVCRALGEYYTRTVSTRAAVDVANDLYDKVVDLPIGFFGQARNSQVMSRFTNDMYSVERGLATLFGKALREPMNLVFYLCYCFWLAPKLTLIAMCIVPLVALSMLVLGTRAKRGGKKALQSRARLLGLLNESLTGIRIVKAFLGGAYEKRRFEDENRRLYRQNRKVIKAEAATGPLVEFLTFVGVAVIIVMGGYYVIRQELKPSTVMTLYVSLGLALGPVRKLANVNTRFQLCRNGAQRIFEYMDTETEKLAAPGSFDLPVLAEGIRFEHVDFGYEDHTPVLRDVDFEVRQGEVVAIVGASGVGKTTLVNLLSRFYAPTSGRILFDGKDIAQASLRSIREQIGLVTQDVLLFDDTVRANIAYGVATPDETRVLAAAKASHVHEFVERMPEGYDTVIGEGGTLLSGGQRQRLAIARAIYKAPAILILDEATSSLDSESEQLIKEALDVFMQGRTTFVIAHRLATVERADKIIVLERGRIQAMGAHEKLVGTSDVYRGLYQRQFRNGGFNDDPENEEETS